MIFSITRIVATLILIISMQAQTQETKLVNVDLFFKQVVELYNKKMYDKSIELLNKNSSLKETNSKWYYFYGLNLARLGQHDEAIENLNVFIKNNDISSTARANYFIGLMYFYKGEYEKAINAFQISLDVSTDINLDKVTDIQIEKSIKYRDYYENHKKTNILFLVGYGFETNAIDISQDLSEESLNGHSLNYGTSISYRPIDKMDFVFEPTLSFVDKYSLDSKFKSNSTIQSNDSMQLVLSTPFIFKNKDEDLQYNLSLNAYASYLPIVTTKRELYLASYFFKGKVLYDLSQSRLLDASIVIAADETKSYEGTDADATGTRYEISLMLSDFLNKEKNKNLTYGLSHILKDSKGIDAKYQKSAVVLGYLFPSFYETNSYVNTNFEYLEYPDKAVKRTDTRVSLDYAITQSIGRDANLSYILGAMLSSSNEDLYDFNDLRASVVYTYNLGL